MTSNSQSERTIRAMRVNHAVCAAALAVSSLFTVQRVLATDISWSRAPGNPGNIGDGTNWAGTVPGLTDTGFIDNGGTSTNAAFTGTMNSLRLGTTAGASGTSQQTGGALSITAELTLGDDASAAHSGAGTYSLSGGTVTSADFYVGNKSIGTAIIGGGTLTSALIHVGQEVGSVGSVTQTAGLVTSNGNMVMGELSTGANLYNISGGTLSVGFGVGTGEFFVGALGKATLQLSGTGVVNVRNFLHFGNDGAGVGSLNMTGGTLNVFQNAFRGMIMVGDNGTGTANISGGTINTRYLAIGQGSFGSGAVTQTGGFVNVSFNLVMHEGHSTPGTLPDFYNMSGGSLAVGNELYIGAHGPATFTLSGASTVTVGGTIHIGASDDINDPPAGFGTLNMSGGTINVTGANAHFVIGDGGSGTLNLSAGSITTKYYNTGQNPGSVGVVNHTGGNATANLSFVVGETSLGDNLYDLSGGGVSVLGAAPSGDMFLGGINGNGTLKVRGTGSVSVAESGHLGAGGGSSGTLNIGGGTVVIGASGLGTGVFIVGEAGIGALIVSSGALTAPSITLGQNAGALGTGTQSGGRVIATNNLSIGEASLADNIYDISGGTLAVGNAGVGGIFIGSTGVGTLRVRGSATVTSAASLTNNGTYAQSGGNASLGVVTGTGQMNISAGALTASSIAQPNLTISGTGLARISPNGTNAGLSVIANLSVTGNGTLDLNDNDMIVTNGSYATITAAIANARNGGTWDQPGITSTSASTQANGATTLGALTGAEYTSVGGDGTFSGTTYNASDVLVKYTWYGDTDFNGSVDFDDYVRIDGGFNSGLTGWLNGDFDFNGGIDFDDYVLIDNAFNTQNGTLIGAMNWLEGEDRSEANSSLPGVGRVIEHFNMFGTDYANAFYSAVPEPTSVGLLAIGAIGALRRRRSA